MSEQHLQSQLDRVYRQVRMMLAPAIAVATDDKGPLLKIQTKIHGTPEIIDGLGLMQFYGFHANPLPGTDVMAMFVGGDRSNGILIASNHQDHRPRNYKPGEIGIYTDEGDTVTLNRDNQLNINSKKQVTVKGKDKVKLDTPLTEIAKDVKAFGKIDASEGFFKNGVAMGGAGAPGPAGPAGPAGPQGPAGPAGSYQAGPGIAINTGTAPPTISTAVPYLPLTGGTINGPLTIGNDQGIGYGGQILLVNTAAGATNPAKYFRISPVGTLELINSAYSAAVFQFTDSGAFALTDRIYLNGITLVAQDANYHYLYDKSGNGAILMGGTTDPEIYYQNTRHRFRGIAGATYDYSIDASGITLQNGIAFVGRKTDNTVVPLAFVGTDNTIRIGTQGGMVCYVGNSGSYFDTAGNLYAAQHVLLKNGFSLYATNAAGTTNYPVIGVASDNRIKINSGNVYNVDAYGAWSHSGTVFNTASSASTGAFHMAPNASGTAYGSFWYNDGTTTYLLLTNNNDALGMYNGLRPFYVDNATGLAVMGNGLNVGGVLQLSGVNFAAQDPNYHYIYDKLGRVAMLLGGSGIDTNYYRTSTHSFQGLAGTGATSVQVAGPVYSTGSNAIFIWYDRSTSAQWAWYASDNYTRLYNGSVGDLILFDNTGNMLFKAGQGVFGKDTAGTDRRLIYRTNDVCMVNDQATSHCNIYAYTGYNINMYGAALVANMTCYKPGGGVWLDSSDVRLKQGIEDYTTSLDAILKLRPRSFEFNGLAETVTGHRYIGLVADEVEDIMPEMVGSWLRKMRPDDDEAVPVKTLDCTALTFALVNAVQELAERLAAVEGRA